jgi:hypothetical protein
MAITLADVQANTQDDVDFNTIDELRMGSPYLLNALTFDDVVVPGTNGGTLTTGYTRIKTTRTATTRQQNTEYPAFEAKKRRVTVNLIPVGARYNIDRVFARVGAASEVDFQQAQAVRATIAKFNDLFINGEAGADFSDTDPEFEGIDSIVTGTITESFATGTTPWDFDSITDKAGALAAKRALDAWLRKFSERPDVFFVNEEGAAWLDSVNDWLSYYTTTADDFGREVPTYKGIPYVNLGTKAGAVDEEDILTGEESEDDIIATSGGVTSIYGVKFGLDSVHGYSLPGTLFDQWLPDFTTAGAVKPGEVELGPVAIAAKKTRGAGAFRVKVL